MLGSTSYYSHAARSIALLGGAAGLPDASDTDYFDDAVVAHEFNHFVDKVVGHSMSRGGAHSGEQLEPNFSWSEGLATGFGCLLLGTSAYIDSHTTNGQVLFAVDVEDAPPSIDGDGIGDEFTVAEVVWDLGDGGAGPADADTDGVAVPLADLYAALDSFDPATDAPYVGLFLQRVVGISPSVSSPQMAAFLAGPPEDQQISYPPAGTDVWPTDLVLGGSDTGQVDSTVPNPCRALAASAWYRLVLASATTVQVSLTINPLPGTGDDLDLYLCDNADVFNFLARSRQPGSTNESISIALQPGTYIIRVEAACGGAGNRAGYTLEVQ